MPQYLSNFVRKYVLQNLPFKLVSLAIAVMLWMAVGRDSTIEIPMTVPLEFLHPPSNLEITSDYPFQAQVTLRGPAHMLQEVRPSQVHALLDLEGAKTGERTFDLSSAQVQVPHDVKVVQVVPAQFRINFDPRATRMVAVQPRVIGTLLSGYGMKEPCGHSAAGNDCWSREACRYYCRRHDRSGGCDRSGGQRHLHHSRLCRRSAGAGTDSRADLRDRDNGKVFQAKVMRQLFGTDGIRGVAGEYPLDRRTVYAIGRALGQRLAARDRPLAS